MNSGGPRRGPAPKVTGLSPKEGPPGTKVTIRGENLGVSPDDLIGLSICGQDCLIYADWQSPSKIIARSMRFKGMGDVIVVTRSGGVGTCTVQFRGYEEAVTLTKDSAVWVNEDDIPSVAATRHRAASSPMIMMPDPLGLEYDGDYDVDEESQDSGETTFGADLITSENFDPALFLLSKHRKAGFLQLRAGLQNLKREVESRENGGSAISPIALLKPNVLSVVECLDALSKVTAYLKADRSQYGQDLTYKIEESIRKAGDDAESIFKDVLEKKDHSDSTRNALNVLQRYRFLFNLPSTIERNIQKGDYDVVINDYARAKALFEKTEIKVFKRVYDEVEQRIEKLKGVLQEKLKQCCSRPDQRSVDEIKKLLRYLVSLGVEGNPAWQSIVLIKNVLLEKMTDCRDRHLLLAQTGKREDCCPDPPRTVLFSEELVSIFNQYYPDLIRLGHDYLSGNLFSRERDESLKAKESIFESEMTQESIRTLVTLIRSALLPHQQQVRSDGKSWPEEKAHDMIVWLPHCLRTILNCYQSLVRHEMAMSSNALQQVQQLIFDFRVYSLTYLFNQVSEEIRTLYMKENWDVNLDNVMGTRTQLPLLFESAVMNQLQIVRETILQTSSADEVDIFTQINVQGQMKQLAQNMLQSFLVALERTMTDDIPSVPKSIYTVDERLLLVMSNCLFVTTHVFPRLQESFDKYSYPDMSLVLKVSMAKFKEYEAKLVKQFTERKRDQVIGSIEPTMYCLTGEWYCPSHKPSDVSYYIKELLENLIAVQAQVFSIAPVLVRRVLVDVIDASIEEVSRLHECLADRFNENGNLQAVLDFKALRTAFHDMESETTDKLLDSSFDHLRPVHSPDDRELLDKLVNQMKQSMHLQLYCFRWEADQTVIVI